MIPFVRREVQKQLRNMVLIVVVINLFINMPWKVMSAINHAGSSRKDSSDMSIVQFLYTMRSILFYRYFCVSRNRLTLRNVSK